MQMRSWAVWCFSVIGLCALANPAWAAPKKKKSKAPKAETTEPAEPAGKEAAPAAISDDSKDIDSLMDDSTKNKPAPVKKQAIAEPDPDKPLYNDDSNTASAWERPPAEAEKPKKKKKKTEDGESVSAPKGDGNNMNIGLLAGYGLSLGSGLTSLNPYSLGAGLVAEYELENHLVVGIGGEYFIGSRDDNALNTQGVRTPAYANYILGHAHVGYSIWLTDSLILRPTLWVGVAVGFVTKVPPHLSGLVVTALLGPGLSLHYILGPAGWYFGGDIRLSIPVGQANSTKTGLPVMLTFGKRF